MIELDISTNPNSTRKRTHSIYLGSNTFLIPKCFPFCAVYKTPISVSLLVTPREPTRQRLPPRVNWTNVIPVSYNTWARGS